MEEEEDVVTRINRGEVGREGSEVSWGTIEPARRMKAESRDGGPLGGSSKRVHFDRREGASGGRE